MPAADAAFVIVSPHRTFEGKMWRSLVRRSLGKRNEHGTVSVLMRSLHETRCSENLNTEESVLSQPPRRPVRAQTSAIAQDMINERIKLMDQQVCTGVNQVTQRVVTYNVLSSSLSQKSRFSKCLAEDLESRTRLLRVISKLDHEVLLGSVICLQEVSMSWSGPLSDFFAQSGYKFVLGLSGNFSNGYLGVGIAYPSEKYDLVEELIERLGKNPKMPKTAAAKKDSFEESESTSTKLRVWRTPVRAAGKGKGLALDEWAFAKSRTNIFTFLRLQCKQTGKTLCCSTYHMPCAFFAPKVMVIHAALAVQSAQRLADGDPLLLAGDFNMKVSDPAYQLVTTGKLTQESGAFPNLSEVGEWTPDLQEPMTSAYMSVNGNEPDFTNYAHISSQGLFVDCLDYIFVSNRVKVLEVDHLPHRSEITTPSFPSKEEPSDHLLIGARVGIPL
mmetsp:Transcript_1003/g.2534  ORF Transcript_1003/g.2534 Transcript_1003/m.2534 type:complete len:444 (-) Transcript_1003:2148-3479(-)